MYCNVTLELLSPIAIIIPLAIIVSFSVSPGTSREAVNVTRSFSWMDILMTSDQLFPSYGNVIAPLPGRVSLPILSDDGPVTIYSISTWPSNETSLSGISELAGLFDENATKTKQRKRK